MTPEDAPDPSNPLYLKRQDHLVMGSREARKSINADAIDPWSRPNRMTVESEEVAHYNEQGYFLGYRKPHKSEMRGQKAKMVKPGDVGGVIFLKPGFRPESNRAKKRARRAEEQKRAQLGNAEETS
jgi:hypothetical protein